MLTKHTIKGTAYKHLFNSEIERLIENYADENKLKLQSAFSRSDYEFYSEERPEIWGFIYHIVFLARPKTTDEILGEQIEFHIKQLQK